MRVVVTGGAGFIGSNLALMLKEAHDWQIVAFDNLHRRGSELALQRLRAGGVAFVHGDIRNPEDLDTLPPMDLVIECSAEPSVHAGYGGGARFLVNTNLVGTFNCLETVRRHGAGLLFLSTSRVYSIAALRALPLVERADRFALAPSSAGPGWSVDGVSEAFSTTGPRSLYGTTKLASELLIEEYGAMYGLKAVIDRCGVVAGPWQMGKVDQGFFVLWAAHHLFGGALRYSGFGGAGRQVRDVLHVADLFDLVDLQIAGIERFAGRVYNVGGGPSRSVSLVELTRLCAAWTGSTIALAADLDTKPADIPYYVSDCRAVTSDTGWAPRRSLEQLLDDVFDWLSRHRAALETILG
jgi:CDP-paratose 2-epimerase